MMPMRWFGPRWDSQICDDLEEVPVPVGAVDHLCGELIDEGDNGVMMTGLTEAGGWQDMPVHKECFLRSVVGGVAHLQGRCRCHGGDAHDDDTMTYRESALAVWEFYQQPLRGS